MHLRGRMLCVSVSDGSGRMQVELPDVRLLDLGVGDTCTADLDAIFAEARKRIKETVAKGMEGPRKLADNYKKFARVVDVDPVK